MNLRRHPLVWLRRFRHRKGYGVHSPFAYSFIRGVLLEPWPYYAYAELDRLHPWWQRHVLTYPVRCRRMLFRLANAVHPGAMAIVGERPVEQAYMSAAVPSAAWAEAAAADLVLIASERLAEALQLAELLPRGATIACEGINESAEARSIWQKLKNHARTTITFDLYTYGIALLDRPLTPADYEVCF